MPRFDHQARELERCGTATGGADHLLKGFDEVRVAIADVPGQKVALPGMNSSPVDMPRAPWLRPSSNSACMLLISAGAAGRAGAR